MFIRPSTPSSGPGASSRLRLCDVFCSAVLIRAPAEVAVLEWLRVLRGFRLLSSRFVSVRATRV